MVNDSPAQPSSDDSTASGSEDLTTWKFAHSSDTIATRTCIVAAK